MLTIVNCLSDTGPCYILREQRKINNVKTATRKLIYPNLKNISLGPILTWCLQNFWDFWTPPPVCIWQLVYTIKFRQPPLLPLLLGDPLPPQCRYHLSMAPFNNNRNTCWRLKTTINWQLIWRIEHTINGDCSNFDFRYVFSFSSASRLPLNEKSLMDRNTSWKWGRGQPSHVYGSRACCTAIELPLWPRTRGETWILPQ